VPELLHVVDGHAIGHRAYHAARGRGALAAAGTFASMLDKLEREQRPRRAVIVFDPPGRTWRHELFAGYKAERPAPEAELVAAIRLWQPIARALGWPAVLVPRFEADDVIAAVATSARARGWAVRVHAYDKDLMQLVDDLVHQVAGGAELGPAEVEAKLGVPPTRVADWLAIAGDAGDGVPGVPGAGAKTAAELVRRFPDLEAVIAANPKIRGRYPLSTIEGIDALRLSRRLVELARDVPVDVGLEAMVIGRRDEAAMQRLMAPPRPPEQLGLGGVPQGERSAPAAAERRTAPGYGRAGGYTRDRRPAAPQTPAPPPAGPLDHLVGEEREYCEERAAVRQHLGDMTRAMAEHLAREDLDRERARRSA
jgi:DNA polymerase-1